MHVMRKISTVVAYILFLTRALFAQEFVVYTTSHFDGDDGLSRYYQDAFTRAKNTPSFQCTYPHLSRTKLIFRAFTHGGHIRRQLEANPRVDAILGLLDYEVRELQNRNLITGGVRVIAESPLTFMINTRVHGQYQRVRDLCVSGHASVIPHPGLSVQGRDMQVHIESACGRNASVRYVHSWGRAYAQFLHGKTGIVASYGGSALFHESSSRYPATQFQPLVFERGHIFHRYTLSLVKPSAAAEEFMRFITDPRHHRAIKCRFYIYPPNSSPKAFLENTILTRKVEKLFQQNCVECRKFPTKKYLYLVLLTGVFSLLCGGIIVIISIGIGILDLCARPRMRRLLLVTLIGVLALPQVLTTPLLVRAWPLDGWSWVFVYEVWFGVAFMSTILIASNRQFPTALLVQVRQLRLSFLRFVRYVYVPQVCVSHRLLFYTVPAILFGTCGGFLFVEPLESTSVNMFLLEGAQQGAAWVGHPFVVFPHLLVACCVAVISQRNNLLRRSDHKLSLFESRSVSVGVMSVCVCYLWPFLGGVIEVISEYDWQGGIFMTPRILTSGFYSLGVALVATCLASLLLIGMVVYAMHVPSFLTLMRVLCVFGLIVPRFIWIVGYENPQLAFILGQSGFALALLIWFNAARIRQMQVTYSPLLTMHRLRSVMLIRGIICPELGRFLLQTGVLTCVCVLNEFVMASAYPMTQPTTLPRLIYQSLERYEYTQAWTASLLLLMLNAVLFSVYAYFNQQRKTQ